MISEGIVETAGTKMVYSYPQSDIKRNNVLIRLCRNADVLDSYSYLTESTRQRDAMMTRYRTSSAFDQDVCSPFQKGHTLVLQVR